MGESKGANVCRNQGAHAARGSYLLFLDSDDLLHETCLAGRVRDLERFPNCDFGVYLAEIFARTPGDRRILWNTYTSESDRDRFLSLDPVWDITGPLWRVEAWRRRGGFDETLLSYHDWDLHVRTLIATPRYFKTPLCDHYYRNEKSSAANAAISGASGTQSRHLHSHERLFQKIFRLLSDSDSVLDPTMRHRIAGQFWWLAGRWRRVPDLTEADRVWQLAWELNLISAKQLRQGRFIQRLYRFKGGGRLAHFIQRSWPRETYTTGSGSLHATPLETLGRLSWQMSFDAHPINTSPPSLAVN
jgi:hypothetical protein